MLLAVSFNRLSSAIVCTFLAYFSGADVENFYRILQQKSSIEKLVQGCDDQGQSMIRLLYTPVIDIHSEKRRRKDFFVC